MAVHGVWFWAPFHMLQAYPMVRVLPLPDFIIPFAHLMWLTVYIGEHWTGLAEPVETAFNFAKSFAISFTAICAFAFWYFCIKMSDNKKLAQLMCFLYFGFMAGSINGVGGFIGSPKKTYEEQIVANADPTFNSHHTLLHVWYLTCLWVATLTVPFEKLSLRGKAKQA